MDIQFRPATHSDIPALVPLVEAAYRGEGEHKGWTTEADILGGRRTDADEVRGCIDSAGSVLLVCERAAADGSLELLGCGHVAVEDGAGYFGMFSVRPELQGAGIGKALLGEAERIVRDEWHLPTMRMTVIDVRQELIDFYERRGYRRTGTKIPYGKEMFGLPKRQDLQFELLEKTL
ncbi:GNAT family N-acetyltransferase [Lysobacter fragariae]